MNGLGSQKNRHLHIVEGFCALARDGGISEAVRIPSRGGLAVLIQRSCGLEYLVNHKAVGSRSGEPWVVELRKDPPDLCQTGVPRKSQNGSVLQFRKRFKAFATFTVRRSMRVHLPKTI